MTQSTRSCILRLVRPARNGLRQSETGGLPLTSSPSSSETGLSYEGEIQLHRILDKPQAFLRHYCFPVSSLVSCISCPSRSSLARRRMSRSRCRAKRTERYAPMDTEGSPLVTGNPSSQSSKPDLLSDLYQVSSFPWIEQYIFLHVHKNKQN